MSEPEIVRTPAELQLEGQRLSNAKVALEIARLSSVPGWVAVLLQVLPGLSVAVAIAGFTFGVVQYTDEQRRDRSNREQQASRDAELAEREYMKPWIENQRAIYLEALAAAEGVTSARTSQERSESATKFWRLFHGRMVLVETREVSGLMKDFGRCLDGSESCTDATLQTRCHALASGMAESMAATAKMRYSDFAAAQFKYGGR